MPAHCHCLLGIENTRSWDIWYLSAPIPDVHYEKPMPFSHQGTTQTCVLVRKWLCRHSPDRAPDVSLLERGLSWQVTCVRLDTTTTNHGCFIKQSNGNCVQNFFVEWQISQSLPGCPEVTVATASTHSSVSRFILSPGEFCSIALAQNNETIDDKFQTQSNKGPTDNIPILHQIRLARVTRSNSSWNQRPSSIFVVSWKMTVLKTKSVNRPSDIKNENIPWESYAG